MKLDRIKWTQIERELIMAVAANDLHKVESMIYNLEDKRILEDVGWVHISFPLHYITLCYDIIWRYPEAWEDITERRAKIDMMLDFWKRYYNVTSFPKIEYNMHNDYYYDRTWETDTELLYADVSDYISAGYSAKDIELYCAVERFDFERVNRLLQEGANPNAHLKLTEEDDDALIALHGIGIEMSHLLCELDSMLKSGKIRRDEDIRLLLALTAHTDMYDLLKQYDINSPTIAQP